MARDGSGTYTHPAGTAVTDATIESTPYNNMRDDLEDALNEIWAANIRSADKTGSDAKIVTGTAGTSTYTAMWNADGDLVDGYEVLDENDMASDDDTALSTQQAIKAYVDSAVSGGIPSGTVAWYAATAAPTGWLECDGRLISRTTYADLFTAIGTTFSAGDGSTTFGIPDLRGQFIRGIDDMGTAQGAASVDTSRVFGSDQTDAAGAHTHGVGTLAIASDSHTHTYSGTTGSDSHSHTEQENTYTTRASSSGGSTYAIGGTSGSTTSDTHSHSYSGTTSSDNHTHTISGSTASTGDTENRPVNVALTAMIKT